MVVFTCGHCGETVQKLKVEKHYLTKCRNKTPNLSCMDCFKDFLGNDYESHIKCITEEERYSGKGFVPKEKKGEKKQNAWVEMLQSVLDEQKNASGNVLRIIETISKHNNTPRKKPKFVNFVKNVCGQKTNLKDIDQAWDLISVKCIIPTQNGNQNQKEKLNPSEANDSDSKKQNGGLKNGNTNSVGNDDEEKDQAPDTEADDEKIDAKKQNGDADDKKLSKKQRKEEKKRKKYEAELLSAEAPLVEENQHEIEVPKKGKKNKNKGNINAPEATNGNVEGKDKNKKRKRQETVSTSEVTEVVTTAETVEVVTASAKVKASKKKLKMERELAAAEANENICLHDQNVTNGLNEVVENQGKFNWHAVIMSVLQKKGNEVPFKRLQKKVLSEYSEFTGCEVDDRIADKFIKKLKSAPNVRVDKNRVLLLEEDE